MHNNSLAAHLVADSNTFNKITVSQLPIKHRTRHAVLAFLTIVVVFSSPRLHGTLITHGNFSVDDGSGLAWLQLSETTGLSWGYIDTQLGVGGQFQGWRYATGSEFDQMVTNQGGTPTSGTTYTGWSVANNGINAYILGQLGAANTTFWQGILADAGANATRYSAVFIDSSVFPESATQDYIFTHGNAVTSDERVTYFSSLLVRNDFSVPEQTPTIFLFGVGLASIAVMSFRRKPIAQHFSP